MPPAATTAIGDLAVTSISLAQALTAALALAYGLAFLGLWWQFRRSVMRSIASGWLVFGGTAALAPLFEIVKQSETLARWFGALVAAAALFTGVAFLDAVIVATEGRRRRQLWQWATALSVLCALAIGLQLPFLGTLMRGPGPRLVVAVYLLVGVGYLLRPAPIAGRRSLAIGLSLLAARMLTGLALEVFNPALLGPAGQPTWFTVLQLLCTMLSGFWLGAAVFSMERAASLHERMQLERRLSDANRMEALGRMARNVAHDFNNILTAISTSGGSAALEGATPVEHAMAARDVDAAVARGAELTRALLSFSKPADTPPAPFDVGRRVDGLASLLQRIAGPGITVSTTVTHALRDTDGRVLGDPVHFDQVICNLVANARDASPPGSQITVRADWAAARDRRRPARADHPLMPTNRPHAVIIVADQGSGIPEELRDKIFEPFFTTKPAGKGTGLGLAAAFAYAQQTRGLLTVDSAVGAGSTFRLYLPLE